MGRVRVHRRAAGRSGRSSPVRRSRGLGATTDSDGAERPLRRPWRRRAGPYDVGAHLGPRRGRLAGRAPRLLERPWRCTWSGRPPTRCSGTTDPGTAGHALPAPPTPRHGREPGRRGRRRRPPAHPQPGRVGRTAADGHTLGHAGGPRRHRPPLGDRPRVPAGRRAGHPPLHPGLPPGRQRLDRHRLQLRRRPLRPRLGGARRRREPGRARRPHREASTPGRSASSSWATSAPHSPPPRRWPASRTCWPGSCS